MTQVQSIEILVTGRLVGGHPMRRNLVTDSKTKMPVMDSVTGQQKTEAYIGIAVPKGSEQNWTQTEWGQKIYQAAAAGWPRGEYNAPNFAWKIVDGDSAVPNKKGNIPNQREGYPGHWILNCSTQFVIKSYHAGKYNPHEQIQNEKEIKPGDYCRVLISAKANVPSESPGVYLNPTLFELSRAGKEIILDSGPNAADAFGSSQAQLPPNAQLDTAVQGAPGGMMPPPAGGMMPPPAQLTNVAGVNQPPSGGMMPPPAQPQKIMTEKAAGMTYDQAIALGWTDETLVQHGLMHPANPGVSPAPGFVNGQ